MKRKTVVILTIITAVLCGCPGIFLCIFGGVTAAGLMPYSWNLNEQSGSGVMPAWVGYVGLCLALIFIAIPIVFGIIALRKKKEPAVVDVTPSEPLPPAS